MSAMRLEMLHVARGDEQQGSGWLRHAGRLAAGIPECALHGYVATMQRWSCACSQEANLPGWSTRPARCRASAAASTPRTGGQPHGEDAP